MCKTECEAPGINNRALIVLSPWSLDLLPALRCDYMHVALPIQEARVSLWCPECLMGLDHIRPTWLTFSLQPDVYVGLIPLVSRGFGRKIDVHSPKPLLSVILFNSPLTKACRQRHSYQEWHFEDPAIFSQVAEGKSKTSARLRLTLLYTD